jgi:c-di-GMP-binding flagellar brake protein YcgR
MVGKELRDINFSLNGSSRLIETNGECIWEGSVNEERYAGIRFKNIKQNHNEMIKDYVYEQKNS